MLHGAGKLRGRAKLPDSAPVRREPSLCAHQSRPAKDTMLRKACVELPVLEAPIPEDTCGDEAAWRHGAHGLGRKVVQQLSSAMYADLEVA